VPHCARTRILGLSTRVGFVFHGNERSMSSLDRAGLEAASCACYRIDRAVYTGLLGC
jgi:hypothetical protein